MTVKIAFLDPAGGDYTPDTPRLYPLGGSQSALCYLAEALAAAGLEVTLVNGTRTAGAVRGVRCLPAAAVSWEGMRAFDVVVLLNGCPTEALTRLRAALDGGRKLILWMQHAVDQPAAQCLADPQARACWDGYAFVSRWQMDGYVKAFGLDRRLCRILRNGIAPAFSGLFPAGADIVAAKPWPPVLAYTSTPFRGLDVLLDSVPRLRAAIPGTTVRVFSSLEGYQVPAGQDPYGALYQRCRDTAGVDYVGAVSQGALAEALRGVTGLAYPNRFAETSCIAVMEALAAGCLVVSSALGALPETTAGFARLIPVPEDPAEHAARFADAASAALVQWRDDRATAGRRLREQVDHVTAGMSWAGRAEDWLAWLDELRSERKNDAAPGTAGAGTAGAAVTANLAEAQQRLLGALGTHLNARPPAGDDHAWREEARALIALIERSLRLDHNTEENRSAVWTTLRGFDAWFAYVTTLTDTPPPAAPPPGGRRIYDCFQFCNELDLLEVRLAELDAVVDRFVLVEATFTHAGDPKPLYYAENRGRFAAYADKIIHVVVADDPGGFAWQREAHQRDAIIRGLDGCGPTDMIVISDADEILRPWVMERLRREPDDGRSLFAPHLDIFLYFLDLKSPDPWVSVAAAPWELIRRIGTNRARYLTKLGHGRVVPDAGWHFTWMGGIERFRAKLQAFAHREMIAAFDQDPAANQERLDRFYATGRFDAGAVPGMWTSLAPVPIDAGFPRLIRERIGHFRALGWISPDASPPVPPVPPVPEEPVADSGPDPRLAVVLDPVSIDAFHALAMDRIGRNAQEEAIGPLRRCVVLDPIGTFHRFHLAHALLMRQRHGEAESVLRDLIRLAPDDHRARANLGIALKNLGRHDEAAAAGRQALALAPAEPGVLSNLGLALSLRTGGDAEAARILRRAVAIDPDFTSARLNLGLVLSKLRRIREAEAQCRRVLDRDPGHAEAHTLLGTCLLLRGALEAGFREYEWRTRLADRQVTPRGLPTPVWDGGNPDGLTILLHDEQGLGDGIQFVRYAPMLRRRGARVIVECNDLLVRLFATLPGVDGVVGRADPPPPHDVHAALLSLPHRFGTTLATIPDEIPYLRAEPERVGFWRQRLGPKTGARLRVGLVWAGNPEFRDDRRRSPGLDALRPLLDVPGVAVFGLQKGAGRRDLERCGPLPPSFTDLGAEIADFADTAAIMANLDLVISSCTAPAHLAGALGCPVWTLLPDIADWRWLERGDTTPWYPTMRLFRQATPGDWASVVADVRAALEQVVATGAAPGVAPGVAP